MNRLPDFKVFIIKNRADGKKPFWIPIGAAWTNRDGSLNVVLDAVPTNGRMHIRRAVSGEAEDGVGVGLADD